MNFYFSWYGNKRRELKHIIDVIEPLIESGEIDKVVEPFCGSCALSLHLYQKYSDKLKYYLNDNDPNLISFLNKVKESGSESFFKYTNEQCENLTKERFDELVNKGNPETLNNWFFSRKVFGIRLYLFPLPNRKYGNYDHKKYTATDNFFKSENTHLIHGDYEPIIETFKYDPKALIFLDPPYFDSFNSGYISHTGKAVDNSKQMKDMTKVYVDIIDLLKSPCKAVTIQNSNCMTRHIYGDFLKTEYDKTYQLTKKKTTHGVFCNF